MEIETSRVGAAVGRIRKSTSCSQSARVLRTQLSSYGWQPRQYNKAGVRKSVLSDCELVPAAYVTAPRPAHMVFSSASATHTSQAQLATGSTPASPPQLNKSGPQSNDGKPGTSAGGGGSSTVTSNLVTNASQLSGGNLMKQPSPGPSKHAK